LGCFFVGGLGGFLYPFAVAVVPDPVALAVFSFEDGYMRRRLQMVTAELCPEIVPFSILQQKNGLIRC
jgi:hypothetical protein